MKDALEDIEELVFEGCTYEAFNTSGGVGHLVNNTIGRVQHLNYKTIRYPGHCEKMRFLIKDLKLAEDRKTLYYILDKSLPRIEDDVLILYASIAGMKDNKYTEKHYFHKIFPANIQGYHWTAMQTATASSACTALDLILSSKEHINGFIPQSWFNFHDFVNNRFACCFKE
jgi:saccharopine dehydrogenase-like NADP-dependent oxidoreductase